MHNRLLPTHFNLDDLLDQIIQRTREIIPFDSGGVAVYDAESGLLAPRAFHTASPDSPLPRLIRLGEGTVGLAAQQRQPLRIDDVNSDARYVPYDSETRSQLAAPMLLGGELLGVLSAESYQANAYTPQHLTILCALSDQAALALHTARLYETLAERYTALNSDNEQLLLRNEVSRMATSSQPIETMLPQMAQRLARLIGTDACLFTLWDGVDKQAYRLAAYGIDMPDRVRTSAPEEAIFSLTRDVMAGGQTIILNAAQAINPPPSPLIALHDAHAILAMPLIARGRPIGATFLMNLSSDRPFTQADADDVAAALDQIALTIDNGLLLQDMQARLSETSALLDIAAIASSRLELSDMLTRVLTLSQKMLGVTAGAVLMYDRYSNSLILYPSSSFGFNDEVLKARFPVNDPTSRISVVFTSGTGYFSNDFQNTTHDNYLTTAQLTYANNILIAPLRVQDEPMGILVVCGKQSDFTRTDLKLLTAMGSHVAAAMRNADLLTDMRERLRETEALQHIAVITGGTLNLDELLESAISEAAELIDVEGAFLLMPDTRGKLLVLHAPSLYGIAQNLMIAPIRTDSGLPIASVYQTGQPLTNNEAYDDPLIQQRSLLFYPINARNRTLGVLALINRRDGDFEDRHAELTHAIASQIAISMENAGLFTAERQRADLMSLINLISQELTATLDLGGLMRKAAKAIHDLLGYDMATIYLLDDTDSIVTVQTSVATLPDMAMVEGFSFPVTQGIVGRAIRTQETQLAADAYEDPDFFWPSYADRAVSDLVVLLRHRERVIGAIEIISLRIDSFQEADRTALETLATQVSTVTENARLWDQAQRRLLEQSIVHQIGQDLSSILDYSELVSAIVRHMTRALDTAMCWLVSYSPEDAEILVEGEYRAAEVVNHPMPRVIGQPPGDVERALIMRAIETRRQVIVYEDDATESQAFSDHAHTFGITAEMALPMVASDRVTGCMMWIETRVPRQFSDDDTRLAQTLTAQAAIAIENARLYRQARRQAREQALLRRVTVSMNALSDTETLLKHFASEVQQAMDADNVLILLHDADGIFRVKASALTTRIVDQLALGRLQHAAPGLWAAVNDGIVLQASSLSINVGTAQHDIQALMGDLSYSLVMLPIILRTEIIGLIEVARDDASARFDAQELVLLEALTNQGSVAIDNVALNEREQRRLRQLEKVQVSSRLLSGQLKIETLMGMIVSEAAAIFNMPAVNLVVPTPFASQYISRASIGLSANYLNERQVEIVYSDKNSPTYIDDLPRAVGAQVDLIRGENIRSVLLVPINKGDQHLGMLIFYSKGYAQTWFEEEIELAQLYVGQAAVALENARLFAELEARAIELAKANKLKSEFLARVSHELRTPMNSINGYSEMLLNHIYGEVNEKQGDRLERILRNGRNLLALIDDLLDISKIDADKMDLRIQPVSLRIELNAAIEVLESQAATRGLYLRNDAPDDLPLVRADSMRLRQVITNLVGNAIKFTKTGGITIESRVKEEAGRAMLYTRVIDTGIGIRAEDQDIIFDEFRQVDGGATREYGGTGLGLAITKKLLEMMGGRIWVESTLGHGSAFTFVLPLATAADKAPV